MNLKNAQKHLFLSRMRLHLRLEPFHDAAGMKNMSTRRAIHSGTVRGETFTTYRALGAHDAISTKMNESRV